MCTIQEIENPTNCNTSNSHPFLHNLQPSHQLHTPSKMQFPRLIVKQHSQIRIVVSNSILHLHDALNILELSLSADRILARASAQTPEDIPCFLFAVCFDEPAGRFGEEPDGGEEDDEEDELECDGESPAEGGFAAVDEG